MYLPATAATTAAATAAATTAAAVTATAAATRLTFARLVDNEIATAALQAVHFFDGGAAMLIGHFDEAEAA